MAIATRQSSNCTAIALAAARTSSALSSQAIFGISSVDLALQRFGLPFAASCCETPKFCSYLNVHWLKTAKGNAVVWLSAVHIMVSCMHNGHNVGIQSLRTALVQNVRD